MCLRCFFPFVFSGPLLLYALLLNRNGESSLPVQDRALRWPSKTPELFLAASLACSRVVPCARTCFALRYLKRHSPTSLLISLPPLLPFLAGCSSEGVRDWRCRPNRLLPALYDWQWRRVRQGPGGPCTTAVPFTLLPQYNGVKRWGSVCMGSTVL